MKSNLRAVDEHDWRVSGPGARHRSAFGSRRAGAHAPCDCTGAFTPVRPSPPAARWPPRARAAHDAAARARRPRCAANGNAAALACVPRGFRARLRACQRRLAAADGRGRGAGRGRRAARGSPGDGAWPKASDVAPCARLRRLAQFSFTYDSYMLHAFPRDELRPLSCGGHVRGPRDATAPHETLRLTPPQSASSGHAGRLRADAGGCAGQHRAHGCVPLAPAAHCQSLSLQT